MAKTLSEISEAMRDIDFCVLTTRGADGGLAGRPMSNNREVDYDGTSWFFSREGTHTVEDLDRDAVVSIGYVASPGLKGLVGAPGMFINVEGRGKVIRDKARFAEHWDKSLDKWFPQGPDTVGTVLIEVRAHRLRYWAGGEDGEITLPG